MEIQLTRKTKIIAASVFLVLFVVMMAGYAKLTGIVEQRLQKVVGSGLTIGSISARWNRVEIEKVRIARKGDDFHSSFMADRIALKPGILASLFHGHLALKEIRIENPYLLVEIGRDGKIINPFAGASGNKAQKAGSSAPPLPVSIHEVTINGGKIDILDRSLAKKRPLGLSNPAQGYHLLALDQLQVHLGRIDIPFSTNGTKLDIKMKSPLGGELAAKGSVVLKGFDSKIALECKGIDIPGLRPYFLKSGDMDITRGKLSIRADISITKKQLNAPGEIVARDLAIDTSGGKGGWTGSSAKTIAAVLANEKGEIRLRFNLNGDIDNPRFSIVGSLVDQLLANFSSKYISSAVNSVGKGVSDALNSGVDSIKSLFK